MLWFYDASDAIAQFLDSGGPVLLAIAVLMCAMWMLILERAWYFTSTHRRLTNNLTAQWNARSEISSWQAHRIRDALISRMRMSVDQNMDLIRTMVSLCPLLGLLGTVTGMIEVFHVLAITGGGDARSMASGVSRATIPTMAGMVAALSGVFANTWLSRRAVREKELIKDHLTVER